MHLSDSRAAKNLIRAFLHPEPTRRFTAEQTLSHTWLTSFATPTKHDPCGPARTLIPGLAGITRSTWRTLLQFVKSNGANNNKKDQLALSSDDGDEHRSSRGPPPSWHTTSGSDTKRRQQHLSLPSLEGRTPWSGLVGLMAKGLQEQRRR